MVEAMSSTTLPPSLDSLDFCGNLASFDSDSFDSFISFDLVQLSSTSLTPFKRSLSPSTPSPSVGIAHHPSYTIPTVSLGPLSND
jgi:hypothetical protein